jgi:hypothetical protein
MAFMFVHFEVDDYDTWKREGFDADPAGRKQAAKRHQIFRGVDDPTQVFVATEYETADIAKAFRERLLASGALDTMNVKTPPTVVEVADEAEY